MDRVRTSSSRPNWGAREARDGVGRIVSNDGGRSGGVGDRGVEPVQDVAAAGTDPIVSGAASAVARVRLAGGWHIVISALVLAGIGVVATVWLPAMGS